ncbi:MAG: hypothetical protein V3V05_07600 [Pontiella sp.]
MLLQKEHFPFQYNSDCRGDSIFMPVVDGKVLSKPQIPVTLPTYDEIIGSGGVSNETFNDHVLSLVKPDQLNVLTIHAEVEGIVCRDLFDDFLAKAAQRGFEVVPTCALLDTKLGIKEDVIIPRVLPGREGWIAFQLT